MLWLRRVCLARLPYPTFSTELNELATSTFVTMPDPTVTWPDVVFFFFFFSHVPEGP